MALDVYFREDVAKVLDAVDMASGGTVALVNEKVVKAMQIGRPLDNEELLDHLRIYRQGYRDALAAVAVAFGIVSRSYAIDPEVDAECLRKGFSALIEECRVPTWGP